MNENTNLLTRPSKSTVTCCTGSGRCATSLKTCARALSEATWSPSATSSPAWPRGCTIPRVSTATPVYGAMPRYADSARVYGNAEVCAFATVRGHAQIYGKAVVDGNATVNGHAAVSGNARVHGFSQIFDFAKVHGYACVNDHARVADYAQVFGHATLRHYAFVSDSARIGNDDICIFVGGDAEIVDHALVRRNADFMTFKNSWSSFRHFTRFRTDDGTIKWKVGCFCGSGDELVAKAYKDSKLSGDCYDKTVSMANEVFARVDAERAKPRARESPWTP